MNFLILITLLSSTFIATVFSAGGGTSNVYHAQDGQGNYGFGYDITDGWGASNFREESGAFSPWGGSVVGSYGLADVDGRKRVVQYSADKNGFVAYIKTNEPGTSDEDAADAYYNGVDWNSGKWLYDFTINHDSWGKGWSSKSDGKKKYTGWSAMGKSDMQTNLKGQIYMDPKTNRLYEAIDEQHVVPIDRW